MTVVMMMMMMMMVVVVVVVAETRHSSRVEYIVQRLFEAYSPQNRAPTPQQPQEPWRASRLATFGWNNFLFKSRFRTTPVPAIFQDDQMICKRQ